MTAKMILEKNTGCPWFAILILSCLPLIVVATADGDDSLAIVPTPKKVEVRQGKFTITDETRICFDVRQAPRQVETTLEPLAEVFASELELLTGIKPETVELDIALNVGSGDIVFRFADVVGDFAADETLENHAYRVDVTSEQIVVEAPYFKGVACGSASLIQTISNNQIPAMRIDDEPTAAYRSVMIDVARNVHSIGVLKDVIRLARLYKLRYVHLHLTDDQRFTFPFEPVTSKLEKNFSYSKEELEELVAYADARGITLIPELDLPGHSTMLRKSGFLNPTNSDADVADLANAPKIAAIIDEMLSVFESSPYFHIGGDESGAGSKLVPFLEAVNDHLRGKPAGQKKRLIVWEGFHGAPTQQLPATGENRIVVMAWESSYNAPWDLLKNRYQLINSSWKPTYLAGGGGMTHLGNSGGRKFDLQDLYRWSKDRFMHWEPGRPIYEDRGPNDDDRADGEWDASMIGKQDQILGGQMQFWEQKESVVIERLQRRLAVAAERLWNPNDVPFEDFKKRLDRVHEQVMTIVQPVEIMLPGEDKDRPVSDFYHPYHGESMQLKFRNRTKIQGVIRYNEGSFSDSLGYFGWSAIKPLDGDAKVYSQPVEKRGGFVVRAGLFRKDGQPVEGNSWSHFNNWKDRVWVTEYDLGRKTPKQVVDLKKLPAEKIRRSYAMPMLRGPVRHTKIMGQLSESILVSPGDGEYQITMQTANGTASLYLDLNQNGDWDEGEQLISNTPTNEERITQTIKLTKGERYRLRVDHMTAMPRLTVIIGIEGPGLSKRTEISTLLELPKE